MKNLNGKPTLPYGKIEILKLNIYKVISAVLIFVTLINVKAEVQLKKIAEAKQGIRTEALASWWGFKSDDATACLQAAINSGVKNLIVDNPGSPWIIKPVKLGSNQKIVFADGVRVIAKKGEFKTINSCLFRASGKKNIILEGKNDVMFIMHKADYTNPEKYKRSEWRHTIALHSVTNVTIRNITLDGSGGDGIYIGRANNFQPFCKDIVIENLNIKNQHRQGISIISAENLTIRNCRISNTKGTPPEAGIDFEPNSAKERIVNCLVENCNISSNAGPGIAVASYKISSKSPLLTVSVKQCKIINNETGLSFGMLSPTAGATPGKMNIEITNTQVSDSKKYSVRISDAVAGLHQVAFKNCQINNSKTQSTAGISLVSTNIIGYRMGDIFFDDVNVNDLRMNSRALSVSHTPFTYLVGAKGSLKLNDKQFNFTGLLKEEAAGFNGIYKFKLTNKDDIKKLKSVVVQPTNTPIDKFYLRHNNNFLQWAEKGQRVKLSIQNIQLGKITSPAKIVIRDPQGRIVKTYSLKISTKPEDLSFTAENTGLFSLEISSRTMVTVKSSLPGQGLLCCDGLHLIKPQGKLYFQVPAGVSKVRLLINGQGQHEWVSAALIAPSGKKVDKKEKITDTALLSAIRPNTSKAEIWAVEFSNSVEDVTLRFCEPLIPVVSANPNLLLRLP